MSQQDLDIINNFISQIPNVIAALERIKTEATQDVIMKENIGPDGDRQKTMYMNSTQITEYYENKYDVVQNKMLTYKQQSEAITNALSQLEQQLNNLQPKVTQYELMISNGYESNNNKYQALLNDISTHIQIDNVQQQKMYGARNNTPHNTSSHTMQNTSNQTQENRNENQNGNNHRTNPNAMRMEQMVNPFSGFTEAIDNIFNNFSVNAKSSSSGLYGYHN